MIGTIRRIPANKLTDSPGGEVSHLKDRYWIVDNDGIYFYIRGRLVSPQCNSNEAITKHLQEKMYPNAHVELIPNIFLRIDSEFKYLLPEES